MPRLKPSKVPSRTDTLRAEAERIDQLHKQRKIDTAKREKLRRERKRKAEVRRALREDGS